MKYIIVFLFCLLGPLSEAQKGWEVGGWAGVSYYFGDLNTRFDVKHPGPAIGLTGRYNFNNRLCLRSSFNYGRVGADDANSTNAFERERNLSFKSNIFDVTGQFEFNFFPYIHGSQDDYYTPYLFLGATIFRYEPTTEFNGDRVKLREMGTEGQLPGDEYFSLSTAWAYGIGFKYDINYYWSINVELSARRLHTDYLDDVSGVYPDMLELFNLRGPDAVALSDRSNDGIGELGRQRGNSRENDSYNFIQVGIVYYIGSLQCPSISKGQK